MAASALPGCGPDNSKGAKIASKPDTRTAEEAAAERSKGKLAPTSRPANYPAPSR